MNLKNLSWQQKLRYLCIGVGAMLLLSWWLSISKTVQLYSDNKNLEASAIRATEAPEELARLKGSLRTLSGKLQQYTADSVTHQQEVMDIVSEFCHKNKLILRSIPIRTYAMEKDLEVETMEITVEGAYHNLLKLLYELEVKQKPGRISSSSFYSFRDHQRNKTILQLKLYIQTIQLNSKAS